MLIDSHYHFDFIKDSAVQSEFVERLAALDIQLVAQTVLPSQFEQVYQLAQEYAQSGWTLRPALGWHPWWIESREQFEVELAIFQGMLLKTRSIGEIGLDDARQETDGAERQLQREVFERILDMIVEQASLEDGASVPYTLSIHAVRSQDDVIDLLERTGIYQANTAVILHRFNGTSDQLMRHIKQGGYLSVHPDMLQTKKGRAYVQQVPAERLLLETDLPEAAFDEATQGVVEELAAEVEQALTETLTQLSELRGEAMQPIIEATQRKLYGNQMN